MPSPPLFSLIAGVSLIFSEVDAVFFFAFPLRFFCRGLLICCLSAAFASRQILRRCVFAYYADVSMLIFDAAFRRFDGGRRLPVSRYATYADVGFIAVVYYQRYFLLLAAAVFADFFDR